MQDIISFVQNQLPDQSILLWLAIVIGIIVVILLLWRLDQFRSLKRLKVGPVEAERFESDRNPHPEPEAQVPTQLRQDATEEGIAVGRIDVSVTDNRFDDQVGDIGGIIVKHEGMKNKSDQ